MYIYTVKATAQCNTMKTPNSFSWSFSFYLNEIHVKSLCNMRMYIEDITRWREDMNFIVDWQNNIFTNERSE